MIWYRTVKYNVDQPQRPHPVYWYFGPTSTKATPLSIGPISTKDTPLPIRRQAQRPHPFQLDQKGLTSSTVTHKNRYTRPNTKRPNLLHCDWQIFTRTDGQKPHPLIRKWQAHTLAHASIVTANTLRVHSSFNLTDTQRPHPFTRINAQKPHLLTGTSSHISYASFTTIDKHRETHVGHISFTRTDHTPFPGNNDALEWTGLYYSDDV